MLLVGVSERVHRSTDATGAPPRPPRKDCRMVFAVFFGAIWPRCAMLFPFLTTIVMLFVLNTSTVFGP